MKKSINQIEIGNKNEIENAFDANDPIVPMRNAFGFGFVTHAIDLIVCKFIYT